ncbi:MAG: hypothetical protein IPK79_02495 [Vampirovibrionales bacterium]|nr:hypothetical protein [Vampirovibrionales bacterium]
MGQGVSIRQPSPAMQAQINELCARRNRVTVVLDDFKAPGRVSDPQTVLNPVNSVSLTSPIQQDQISHGEFVGYFARKQSGARTIDYHRQYVPPSPIKSFWPSTAPVQKNTFPQLVDSIVSAKTGPDSLPPVDMINISSGHEISKEDLEELTKIPNFDINNLTHRRQAMSALNKLYDIHDLENYQPKPYEKLAPKIKDTVEFDRAAKKLAGATGTPYINGGRSVTVTLATANRGDANNIDGEGFNAYLLTDAPNVIRVGATDKTGKPLDSSSPGADVYRRGQYEVAYLPEGVSVTGNGRVDIPKEKLAQWPPFGEDFIGKRPGKDIPISSPPNDKGPSRVFEDPFSMKPNKAGILHSPKQDTKLYRVSDLLQRPDPLFLYTDVRKRVGELPPEKTYVDDSLKFMFTEDSDGRLKRVNPQIDGTSLAAPSICGS